MSYPATSLSYPRVPACLLSVHLTLAELMSDPRKGPSTKWIRELEISHSVARPPPLPIPCGTRLSAILPTNLPHAHLLYGMPMSWSGSREIADSKFSFTPYRRQSYSGNQSPGMTARPTATTYGLWPAAGSRCRC
ncbi:hypothetical protein DFH07DRAFT_852451 [Mycena maculata]|uniref:Uncharacterized protein n=1 Tax=Mycena maculata TaxID=230809 RepID=A0AAD7MQW4_9AGAR|nr:hypothetical protein DFH07DRAFT_852451 [Mycena maculata]